MPHWTHFTPCLSPRNSAAPCSDASPYRGILAESSTPAKTKQTSKDLAELSAREKVDSVYTPGPRRHTGAVVAIWNNTHGLTCARRSLRTRLLHFGLPHRWTSGKQEETENPENRSPLVKEPSPSTSRGLLNTHARGPPIEAITVSTRGRTSGYVSPDAPPRLFQTPQGPTPPLVVWPLDPHGVTRLLGRLSTAQSLDSTGSELRDQVAQTEPRGDILVYTMFPDHLRRTRKVIIDTTQFPCSTS